MRSQHPLKSFRCPQAPFTHAPPEPSGQTGSAGPAGSPPATRLPAERPSLSVPEQQAQNPLGAAASRMRAATGSGTPTGESPAPIGGPSSGLQNSGRIPHVQTVVGANAASGRLWSKERMPLSLLANVLLHPFSGLDKNQNIGLPFGQPALPFSLPEAILNSPKVQSMWHEPWTFSTTLARRASDRWNMLARQDNLLALDCRFCGALFLARGCEAVNEL